MRFATVIALVATLALYEAKSLETVNAEENQQQAPKTQLEAFTGKVGVVIIKGYTEVGYITETGRVDVYAMTFRNAKSGEEKSGVVIVVKGAGSYEQEDSSLVDYDEINDLLEGIAYVSKTEKSATKLRRFEAIYSTKGDLKINVFNESSGKKSATIKVGTIRKAYVSMEGLTTFARLIRKAKDILDNPETVAASSPVSSPPMAPMPATRPKPVATPQQQPAVARP